MSSNELSKSILMTHFKNDFGVFTDENLIANQRWTRKKELGALYQIRRVDS